MNNIRELRLAKGWSQRQLAERMSTEEAPVHFTTIAKIEKSMRRLTFEWASRFAAALGVTVAEVDPTFSPAAIGVTEVPVLGLVAASRWSEAIRTADTLPLPSSMVSEPNAFALEVTGDSMNLVSDAGGFAIVDPDQKDLLDGQCYVVMNSDHETTFKVFRTDPARLEPSSTNPEHVPIPLGQSPVTVIGKVILVIARR